MAPLLFVQRVPSGCPRHLTFVSWLGTSEPPARGGPTWVCVRAARARCPVSRDLFLARIVLQRSGARAAFALALVVYAAAEDVSGGRCIA